MIPNNIVPIPFIMVCPKCGYYKFYPRGIGCTEHHKLLSLCPKCKKPLERKQEINVIKEIAGNLSHSLENLKKIIKRIGNMYMAFTYSPLDKNPPKWYIE